MKAARFDYARPREVREAVMLLAGAQGAGKAVAGSQSLGPMLNLRLAQPGLLVDLRGIDELRACRDLGDHVALGACVTHAEIEDGRVPDASRGLLAHVARHIAYRAVRNRGTLGGSLAHADPAADWVSAMLLLDARLECEGPGGRRSVAAAEFFHGAFATALAEDEVIVSVSMLKLSSQARWSYWKYCRKAGEFAEAIGALLLDPSRGAARAVVGALDGPPSLVEEAGALAAGDAAAIAGALDAAGLDEDGYERDIHATALARAAALLARAA